MLHSFPLAPEGGLFQFQQLEAAHLAGFCSIFSRSLFHSMAKLLRTGATRSYPVTAKAGACHSMCPTAAAEEEGQLYLIPPFASASIHCVSSEASNRNLIWATFLRGCASELLCLLTFGVLKIRPHGVGSSQLFLSAFFNSHTSFVNAGPIFPA